MFAQPRPKKSILPPPSKKRKTIHSVEEVSFDNDARAEYLTGFHKRKVQRQKHAQEIAAQKARQERNEFRKQLRDERKQAVETHVQQVNALLREAQRAGQDEDAGSQDGSGADEWNGLADDPPVLPVDHEEEYIDEDRYTTVTVESVIVDREGIHKPEESDEGEGEDNNPETRSSEAKQGERKQPLRKKKKFRYETKLERQKSSKKQRASRRR